MTQQENKKGGIVMLMPVLFGFFVMGFCDVVGVATSYAKNAFGWSETLAGFLPSAVFIWFLLLSVPAAMMMNKLGRKNMVQLSNLITIFGMLIPFVTFTPVTCMIGFALLGIGNTILQVSLNPLVTNVVSGKGLTSALNAGQVVKAVSSFCGPIIAAQSLALLGSWEYLFPIFGLITLLSGLWLQLTPIHRETVSGEATSMGATFGLLRDSKILLLFLGIMFVVGVDVGVNTVAPKLLIERCGFDVAEAGIGSSVYFLFRTAGAFVGTFLLAKMSDIRYFRINILLALAFLISLFFLQGEVAILVFVGLVGFACSSIFSVIYAQALKARPDKANEISGLMITGVCGGAVIPPLMGVATEAIGSQAGSLIIIGLAIGYLIFCSLTLKSAK
ncbi:MAG: MFS transporter [Rikenellaceae bacterium]|nr:MFS transporter [Rikenellaceae bacterium]